MQHPAVDSFSRLTMGQWWYSAWPAVTCHPQSMRGKTFFLACLCSLHLAKYSLTFASFVHQIPVHFGSFLLFLTIIFPDWVPVPFHHLSSFCSSSVSCVLWSTDMKLAIALHHCGPRSHQHPFLSSEQCSPPQLVTPWSASQYELIVKTTFASLGDKFL